jgi:hypothetical protein
MQNILKIHADILCCMTEWSQQVRAVYTAMARRPAVSGVSASYATRTREGKAGGDIDLSIAELDSWVHTTLPQVNCPREAQDAYRRQIWHHAPELLPLLPSNWCDSNTGPSTTDIADNAISQNPVFESITGKHRSRQAATRNDRGGDGLHQRRGSFRAAIQHYQGRGANPVPERIVKFIVQRLRANKRNIQDASRAHIACILRSSRRPSFSRHYRDISHIHATVTGQTPPDVSRYEAELMLMFGIGFFLLLLSLTFSINRTNW